MYIRFFRIQCGWDHPQIGSNLIIGSHQQGGRLTLEQNVISHAGSRSSPGSCFGTAGRAFRGINSNRSKIQHLWDVEKYKGERHI
jgi:hypothetical protein